MARPMTIFCGKGGVGKTSLSLAFALWHAIQGLKALVVTSHPLRELALSVSLAGLKESHPQAAANLFVVHIDPHEVLSSTIKQAFKSALLVDALLSSRIYQSLIEVAPGLKEIAFLSRVQQLAQQGFGQQAPAGFDLLVWDTPATGHFLRTLETSKRFDSYLSGPLSILGKGLVAFFSDPTNLTLLPVTILEEMAVEETIELNHKLIRELNMPPAGFICNMASPMLGTPDAVFENLKRDAERETNSGDLRFILDRHAIERELFRKLCLTTGGAAHIVQRKSAWNSDVELLLDISQQVAKFHGARHP